MLFAALVKGKVLSLVPASPSLPSNSTECHVFPTDHSIKATCLSHICMLSTRHKSIVVEKCAFNFAKKKKRKKVQSWAKNRLVEVSKRKREFLLQLLAIS